MQQSKEKPPSVNRVSRVGCVGSHFGVISQIKSPHQRPTYGGKLVCEGRAPTLSQTHDSPLGAAANGNAGLEGESRPPAAVDQSGSCKYSESLSESKCSKDV